MSRNTDKIIKALKNKGYKPVVVSWTPIGGCPIMSGPEGGWYIEFEEAKGRTAKDFRCSDWSVIQYNIHDAMEEINALPVLEKEIPKEFEDMDHEDLKEYCDWENGEIPHKCDAVCEGAYCERAYKKYLENFEDDGKDVEK